MSAPISPTPQEVLAAIRFEAKTVDDLLRLFPVSKQTIRNRLTKLVKDGNAHIFLVKTQNHRKGLALYYHEFLPMGEVLDAAAKITSAHSSSRFGCLKGKALKTNLELV